VILLLAVATLFLWRRCKHKESANADDGGLNHVLQLELTEQVQQNDNLAENSGSGIDNAWPREPTDKVSTPDMTLRQAITRLQAAYRGTKVRARARRRETAAVRMQAFYRGIAGRSAANRRKMATIHLQAIFRGAIVRFAASRRKAVPRGAKARVMVAKQKVRTTLIGRSGMPERPQ